MRELQDKIKIVPPGGLSSESEFGDEGPVTAHVSAIEILEQPTPLSDEAQEAAPGRFVVMVEPQMLGETVDPAGHDGHLHLGGAGVAIFGLKLLDY